MKKSILLTLALTIMLLSSVCHARPLPNSEFCLGGVSVMGMPFSEVKQMYGNPRLVEEKKYYNVYVFGDSVTLHTSKFGNNERVQRITVTANNGWGTPAGLTVGMKTSTLFDLYGYESPRYDKKTGFNRYIYPHMGTGAGAGMYVDVDKKDTIRQITVVN